MKTTESDTDFLVSAFARWKKQFRTGALWVFLVIIFGMSIRHLRTYVLTESYLTKLVRHVPFGCRLATDLKEKSQRK